MQLGIELRLDNSVELSAVIKCNEHQQATANHSSNGEIHFLILNFSV